jgi:hypothetical protein
LVDKLEVRPKLVDAIWVFAFIYLGAFVYFLVTGEVPTDFLSSTVYDFIKLVFAAIAYRSWCRFTCGLSGRMSSYWDRLKLHFS